MSWALRAVVLSALLVLSGCAGVFGGDTSYPPGVTESGVENATALADAHTDHLYRGYRLTGTTTYRAPNGTILQQISRETRWSQSERSLHVTFERPHQILGTQAEMYSNGSGTWIHIHPVSGEPYVQTGATGSWRTLIAGPTGAWGRTYSMASAPNTTTTVFENGTTRIRFSGARVQLGNALGTMYITQDGLITRYELTYEGTWRNHRATVHTTITYTNIANPDVHKPDWNLPTPTPT